MDNNIVNYLIEKTGTDDLLPVNTNSEFDRMIIKDYNFLRNGREYSHTFMSRTYNGTNHNSDSTVRFMKSLRVIVSQNKDLKYNPDRNKLYVKKISLKKNTNFLKAVISDYEQTVYSMFANGDITPIQMKEFGIKSDNVSIHYNIGDIITFSADSSINKDSYNYYICVPYESELVTTKLKEEVKYG